MDKYAKLRIYVRLKLGGIYPIRTLKYQYYASEECCIII